MNTTSLTQTVAQLKKNRPKMEQSNETLVKNAAVPTMLRKEEGIYDKEARVVSHTTSIQPQVTRNPDIILEVEDPTYAQPEQLVKAVDFSQDVFNKSSTYGPNKYAKGKVQDLHKRVVEDYTIQKDKEDADKTTVDDINEVTLTYAYGSHNEQGRVLRPAKFPLDKVDRALLKVKHEVVTEVQKKYYRPNGLYDGIHKFQ